MEKAVIKLGIGVSIPLTIVSCYIAGRIGVMVGRYEAYKEVANSKSKEDTKED